MLLIDRYIIRQFLSGVLIVLLLLLILFSFMSLADELSDVGKGNFKLTDALMVVVLSTPKRLMELLPVTLLLGGLLGLGAMANHREIVALRAAGISKQRIAMTIAGLALVLAGLVLILQFTAIPMLERQVSLLHSKTLANTSFNKGHNVTFWSRNGQSFIRMRDVKFGRELADIEIYTLDRQGQIIELVEANHANYLGADNWLLSEVSQTRLQPEIGETHTDSLTWKNLLSKEQAKVWMLPLEALAPDELLKAIANLEKNKLDSQRYQIAFWQQVSLLPALLAMALLSLPFLLGSVRSIPASQRVIVGGMIGIGFYLLQQMTGQVAGFLGINPAYPILAPALILLSIAIYSIRHKTL